MDFFGLVVSFFNWEVFGGFKIVLLLFKGIGDCKIVGEVKILFVL